MKTLVISGVLIAAAFTLASGGEVMAERPADFTHRAAIVLDSMPGRGLVELKLTPEVFDLAKPDLSDLRVFSEAGEAAPYVLGSGEGKTRTIDLPVKLYNRTFVPGKQTSVTVDFGSKILKNRVEVATPGTNFRRSVLVEGCDDGTSWQKLREGAFLFRIATGQPGTGYDKKAVELPENDLRYLRVTVFNAPDDPQHLEIKDVKASRTIQTPPDTAAVPIVASDVVQKEKERATEVILDLGHQNLPLHQVALGFADANFFRYITVSARNKTERIVSTPVEDGPPREETVEEPWRHVSSGAIYRYSSAAGADESLTLTLKGVKTRYLRIRIANADNPPLQFQGAIATRLARHLSLKPEAGASYGLYFGNPKAARPSYDLPHYADRLRQQGLVLATLGPAGPNPLYKLEVTPPPWSERYAGAVWVVLLLAVGVLGLLVYRQIKAAPAGE